MKITNEEIGQRLLTARKKLGLSQTEMGEQADISRSYIGHVEHGDQNPSFEFLVKISEAFHISLDWLIFGRGQMEIIPEEHYLNQLGHDHVVFLEKFLALSKEKKGHLLKVFNDIIDTPE